MSTTKKSRKSPDQIAGVGVTYKIGEQTYTLSPINLWSVLGEVAGFVRSSALAAVEANLQKMHPGAKRDIITRVAMKPVPLEASYEWLSSYDGVIWMIEKSLAAKHPEITGAEIRQWRTETLDEVAGIVARISGIGPDVVDGDSEQKKPDGDDPDPTSGTTGVSASPS